MPNAKLGALADMISARTVVRLLMVIGALLVGVGIFMRWYAIGDRFELLYDGFSGVDLGNAGMALLMLATLLLVLVAVDKPLMAASAGIALLVVSALILMNWDHIFLETWGHIVQIECMPPCNTPEPGAGVFATVGGAVIATASGIVAWLLDRKKRPKDSESAHSAK